MLPQLFLKPVNRLNQNYRKKSGLRSVDRFDRFTPVYGNNQQPIGGLKTGGKALVNGAFTTVMDTITAGQFPGDWELIEVTDTDRAYGYDYSKGVAQVATTIAIAALTMGVGCVAAQGSKVAGAAVFTINTLDGINAMTNIANGVSDVAANGLTLTNALNIGMGAVAIGGLKASQCFTAETQVVVDDKIRDKVYFTETTEYQSFDEVNILFTFAGLSSAFGIVTIARKKQKTNKSIPIRPSAIYKDDNRIDDGLISDEVDESKRTFSFGKWFILPLLIIATIICGYLALPTTRSVAVSVPKIEIKDQLVTKNIEDIKIGDEVFAYDVTTGQVSKCKVTDTFERTADHLRYLTVQDLRGVQVFETTDSHPFWVVTDNPDLSRSARDVVVENGIVLNHENLSITNSGYYVEAKDLRLGDTFIGLNGEISTLESTTRKEFSTGIKVYNFTVENNHNYYVIANYEAFIKGAKPVLVHNAGKYGTTNTNVNNDQIKVWIKHDTYNEIRNTFGKKVTTKFVNSMKKGIVPADGMNGIKYISGKNVGGKIYSYEIKIKGDIGKARVYGNFDSKTGYYIFDKFKKDH